MSVYTRVREPISSELDRLGDSLLVVRISLTLHKSGEGNDVRSGGLLWSEGRDLGEEHTAHLDGLYPLPQNRTTEDHGGTPQSPVLDYWGSGLSGYFAQLIRIGDETSRRGGIRSFSVKEPNPAIY